MNNNLNLFRLIPLMAFICLALLSAAGTVHAANGNLSLVSMGTGDPENMSLRARKAIESADLFFSMGKRESHPELIKGKPVYEAEHGLFGEGGAKPRRSAEAAAKLREENRKLIRTAVAAGKNVVILDNGDPTIFGPQIGYMKEFSDLKPVVIPGISSFNAANAALQTSVVSGKSRAIMLTSGSLAHGRDDFLAGAVNEGVTLALFMVRDLEKFIDTMSAKVPRETPVAIVSNAGSSSREKVVIATLGTLSEKIKGIDLGAYLLYIGESIKG
ncbi:SAM-dependent methyltransferase [uncultured Desulfuromusa sp.]|uniref:SAM-dependent methyltransferase n=1 Tax=uncultured Desulfuromusa sp. TaxID=219183 RepID=UPI002AA864BA|nr:SAM-dependent methyltransferase [uncultured Desulfuromusa sp.]